jgi:hypothetical protein
MNLSHTDAFVVGYLEIPFKVVKQSNKQLDVYLGNFVNLPSDTGSVCHTTIRVEVDKFGNMELQVFKKGEDKPEQSVSLGNILREELRGGIP